MCSKDIIAYQLLQLIDGCSAIQFILSSHHTYHHYYSDYRIKDAIASFNLLLFAYACGENGHQFPQATRIFLTRLNNDDNNIVEDVDESLLSFKGCVT
jgi:hypothetical protein